MGRALSMPARLACELATSLPPLLDSGWIAGAWVPRVPASREMPMRKPQATGLVRTLAFAVPVACVLALPGPAAGVEQKLIASDGFGDDRFGRSVAIEGNTIVIGAPSADGAQGAIYVYQRTGKGWTRSAKLTASDGAAGDLLGSSVALDGDVIVAGASADDVDADEDQGSVYTFARTGVATRGETAKLTASDGAAGDRLGGSVAVDGEAIVAGASMDAIGANAEQGSVYTFARTGAATRGQTAKLIASDGVRGARLGFSVALHGETIVAGASMDTVGANGGQGSAYTFARTGAPARGETAKLTASDGTPNDALGFSVAIEGDTIVAGAETDAIEANAQGSVYTFTSTGAAARHETAKLIASDGGDGDLLGFSVAIDGDTIVAGAPSNPVFTGPGSAYTFARTGAAARSETARLTADDGAEGDLLGFSVAVDGDTIVAGAPTDDIGASERQGSASVFFPPVVPSPPREPTGAGPAPRAALEPGPCANLERGTGGADTLTGTSSGDTLLGLGGADLLSGLAGDDCLTGGPGADRVGGGPGNDRLRGSAGRDALHGGAGNDRLSGGAGNDRLTGGSGNDRLAGGGGRNRLSAGAGSDRVDARNGRPDRVDCGAGRDRARVDRSDRLRRCERVRRGRRAGRATRPASA